jgi:hypothetical protein
VPVRRVGATARSKKPVPNLSVTIRTGFTDFVQLVLVLHHFCTNSVPTSSCFRRPFALPCNENQNMKPHTTSLTAGSSQQQARRACRATRPPAQVSNAIMLGKRARAGLPVSPCTNHPSPATDHRTRIRSHPSPAAQSLPLPSSIVPAAAIFTRPSDSTRTLRMFLIDGPAIRNARNSLKTNNGDHF